ncbi:ABC transporter permease [Mycoplasma todarodis]|uniref:ABC transporter permease n=1 Tax=Mycoplasma todarodis TaxID=1937191 RepID=UPI003B510964
MSKKVSTYLIPVIFAISFFLMVGLPALLTQTPKPMINTVLRNPLTLILPFIISAIFVAVKALNIFKDSEDDGTELLIVSKPITRFKLVLGKFASLYTMMFFFSIFTFVFAALIGTADKYASSKQIIEFAASAAFGTFIIQLLLSSIIVFFASVFGKVGTIIVSILVPLILTISSLILVPFSHSQISSDYTKTYVVQSKEGKFVQKDIYGFEEDDKSARRDIADHEKSWYKTAAYFDVWTQLSSFYSIFQPEKIVPGSLGKWSIAEGKTNNLSKLIDSKLIYKNKATNKEFYLNPINQNLFSEDTVDLGSLNKAKQIYDEHSDQIATEINKTTKPISDKYEWGDKIFDILKGDFKVDTSSLNKEIVSGYILINLLNDGKMSIAKLDSEDLSLFSGDIKNLDNISKDVQIIEGKPYIPRALLYTMWLIITFGIGGLVMVRYMRRDFK